MEYDEFYRFLETRPISELSKCQQRINEIMIGRQLEGINDQANTAITQLKTEYESAEKDEHTRIENIMKHVVDMGLILPRGMNAFHSQIRRFIRWLPGYDKPAPTKVTVEQKLSSDWFIHKEFQVYIHWNVEGYYEMSSKDSRKFNLNHKENHHLITDQDRAAEKSQSLKRKSSEVTTVESPRKQSKTAVVIPPLPNSPASSNDREQPKSLASTAAPTKAITSSDKPTKQDDAKKKPSTVLPPLFSADAMVPNKEPERPPDGSAVYVTQGAMKSMVGKVLGSHWASPNILRVQFTKLAGEDNKVVNLPIEHLSKILSAEADGTSETRTSKQAGSGSTPSNCAAALSDGESERDTGKPTAQKPVQNNKGSAVPTTEATKTPVNSVAAAGKVTTNSAIASNGPRFAPPPASLPPAAAPAPTITPTPVSAPASTPGSAPGNFFPNFPTGAPAPRPYLPQATAQPAFRPMFMPMQMQMVHPSMFFPPFPPHASFPMTGAPLPAVHNTTAPPAGFQPSPAPPNPAGNPASNPPAHVPLPAPAPAKVPAPAPAPAPPPQMEPTGNSAMPSVMVAITQGPYKGEVGEVVGVRSESTNVFRVKIPNHWGEGTKVVDVPRDSLVDLVFGNKSAAPAPVAQPVSAQGRNSASTRSPPPRSLFSATNNRQYRSPPTSPRGSGGYKPLNRDSVRGSMDRGGRSASAPPRRSPPSRSPSPHGNGGPGGPRFSSPPRHSGPGRGPGSGPSIRSPPPRAAPQQYASPMRDWSRSPSPSPRAFSPQSASRSPSPAARFAGNGGGAGYSVTQSPLCTYGLPRSSAAVTPRPPTPPRPAVHSRNGNGYGNGYGNGVSNSVGNGSGSGYPAYNYTSQPLSPPAAHPATNGSRGAPPAAVSFNFKVGDLVTIVAGDYRDLMAAVLQNDADGNITVMVNDGLNTVVPLPESYLTPMPE